MFGIYTIDKLEKVLHISIVKIEFWFQCETSIKNTYKFADVCLQKALFTFSNFHNKNKQS